MDPVTLAMAKSYADSQRLGYEVTETVSEPLNITWDGNTEGLVSATIGNVTYYKVSDLILSDSVVQSATITYADGTGYYVGDEWIYLVDGGQVTDEYVSGEGFYVIRKPVTINGTAFDEPGVYFIYFPAGFVNYMASPVKVEYEKTTVHPIDPKYLPPVDSVILNSTTEGSTKKFKLTVDDSGTVSTTEVT